MKNIYFSSYFTQYFLINDVYICKPKTGQAVARQAHPPINILMYKRLFLPNFFIAGHSTKYVGNSTTPARKKFKCSSELRAGA